ncbi:MAG: hypothetical protein ABIP41_01965 [Croceibacterium sp.]
MAVGVAPADAPDEAGLVAYEGGETDRSLIDDVEALIGDGKAYLEAELAFQGARAAVLAEGAKAIATFGALAAGLAMLALVGLTVGLILALTPLITAWGATAVVVGLLLVGVWLAVRAARKRWQRMMAAAGPAAEPPR